MTSTSTYVGEPVDQTTCDLELLQPTESQTNPCPGFEPRSEPRPQPAKLEIECLCPFCGSFNSGVGKPCNTCRQEDTIATRAATTRRQGPWYVLQENDLDAPGMNFDQLLKLVRNKTVTSRSVIRGATTGQLWRLASRVRGLSREFGQCYSCGGDIETDETNCPHCDRVQTVLEHADVIPPATVQKVKATVQQIKASEHLPFHEAIKAAADPAQAVPFGNPFQSPAPLEQSARPAPLAEPVIHVHSLSHPDQAAQDPEIASRPVVAEAAERHIPKDDLLTPRDVAKAFQLEFGPDQLDRFLARPNYTMRKIKIALSSTAALAVAGLMLWPLTHVVSGWINDGPAKAAASVSVAAPDVQPPAGQPDARPASEITYAQSDRSVYPAPASGAAVMDASSASSNAMVTPVMLPEPTPTPSPEDDPKRLWSSALEAESTGNYASAVQAYERIESLPSDSWPANLETRLTLARKELKGDVR